MNHLSVFSGIRTEIPAFLLRCILLSKRMNSSITLSPWTARLFFSGGEIFLLRLSYSWSTGTLLSYTLHFTPHHYSTPQPGQTTCVWASSIPVIRCEANILFCQMWVYLTIERLSIVGDQQCLSCAEVQWAIAAIKCATFIPPAGELHSGIRFLPNKPLTKHCAAFSAARAHALIKSNVFTALILILSLGPLGANIAVRRPLPLREYIVLRIYTNRLNSCIASEGSRIPCLGAQWARPLLPLSCKLRKLSLRVPL